MRKIFTILMFVVAVAAGTNLYAQKGDGPVSSALRFGVGLEGGLPTGALKYYDAGAGLSLRFSKGLTESIAGTLSVGAMGFFPTSTLTASSKASIFIPIKAGGKFYFGKNVYASGELGVTITKTYQNVGTKGGFVNGSSFTYAPGVGVQFGSFDLGARYEGLDNGGFMGVRLGFDF